MKKKRRPKKDPPVNDDGRTREQIERIIGKPQKIIFIPQPPDLPRPPQR